MTSPTPSTSSSSGDADDRVLNRYLEKHRAKKNQRLEKGAQYREYLRWSGKALEVPLSVVVGLLLGKFLGTKFGFEPWGTWGGIFFGTLAAIRAMYRITVAYKKEHPDDEPPTGAHVP